MPQPWFLGMDNGDMPMKPVQWTETLRVSAMAEQQRHDELLRMRCVELTFAECFEQGTVAAARNLYREVTGREWPVWPEPQINP